LEEEKKEKKRKDSLLTSQPFSSPFTFFLRLSSLRLSSQTQYGYDL